ncbi:MAG: hypothetical protein IH884_07575 [Myxococcales bacterium]|nr:hypothetical protein [Myxococcales bacterium]
MRGAVVMSTEPKELVDEIVREYIDFVNDQVGVYMSALAGFAGHHARVSRQIHRANRPVAKTTDEEGMPTIVWASYEDPRKPDIIHNQIIRSDDYLEATRRGGRHEQQHARAILIFLYTYWEYEIRPRLALSEGVEPNEIQSDIMGDLRTLRNVILHAKGVLRPDKHAALRLLGDMFEVDQELVLSYEGMHRIFVLIKQECARLVFEWLSVEDGPVKPEDLQDVAIQLGGSRGRKAKPGAP